MVSAFENKKLINALLVLVLLLSAVLRFWNLEIIPWHYIDEGSNLEIAWNLMHGQTKFLAIQYNFVPHLPFFYLLAGLFTLIFGKTFLAIRVLTALLGILATWQIFLIGKAMGNKKVGLMAALIFAGIGNLIAHNRIGYSGNLVMVLLLFVLLWLLKYLKTKKSKWFYLAGLSLGLAMVTEITSISVLAPALIFLIFGKANWRRIIKFCFIALIPLLLFIIVMSGLRGGNFWADAHYYFFGRYAGSENPEPWYLILIIYGQSYAWAILGVMGLFIVPRFIRFILLGFFIFTALPYFLAGQVSIVTRNMMVFFPYWILLVAFSIQTAYQKLLAGKKTTNRLAFYSCLFISLTVLGLIFYSSTVKDTVDLFTGQHGTASAGSWFAKPETVKEVAANINQKVQDNNDLIIAYDYFVPYLNCRLSNIWQAAAFEGIANDIFYPGMVQPDRLFYNIDYRQAKFVITEQFYQHLFPLDYPQFSQILDEIAKWPIVYGLDNFTVYQNPSTI